MPDSPALTKNAQKTEQQDKVNRMGTGKLGMLIIEFAIPAIIGNVVNGSYNIMASIFLGIKLGEIGLATTTIAMPITTVSMAISILVGAGGNALAAIKLGEGERDTAERVLANAFILSIVLAVLAMTLIYIFMDPVLMISGATPELMDSARVFVGISVGGFIFQFFGMGFVNFMRTAGNPSGALLTVLAGALTSIALSFLFVMVLDWGIAGAAWATVFGFMVQTVIVLNYFIRSKTAPFKLKLSLMKPDFEIIRRICVLGSAAFVMQALMVVINLLLNNQLVTYGSRDPIGVAGALASIGVMSRINMFCFFPVLGVNIAVQPLIGFNFGAKKYDRVKRAYLIALVWAASFGVFFWLLVHIFPGPIVGLFGVDEALLEFTIDAVQVMMMLIPFIGIQMLTAGYFQATGQPMKSMFVSLTRQLLYLIPLLYLLPHAVERYALPLTQLQSLYYSYPIADALSIFTAGAMILIEWRRLTRMQIAQRAEQTDGENVAELAEQAEAAELA